MITTSILNNNTPVLLRKSIMAVMVMIVLLAGFGNASASNPYSLSNDRGKLQLNPKCKLKRLSTGKVIIITNKGDGEVVRHEFENIFAEVLLGALRRQTIDQLVPVISRKYYYSEDECRREIKHAINVLEEWDILVPRKPEVL